MSDRLDRSARRIARPPDGARRARDRRARHDQRRGRALGYSQPAVSQQLRRAEERPGIALVVRVGRGIRPPNPAGYSRATRTPSRPPSRRRPASSTSGAFAPYATGSSRSRRLVDPGAAPPRRLARPHPGIAVTYVESEPPEAGAAAGRPRRPGAHFSYPGDRDNPHRGAPRARGARPSARPVDLALPFGHPLAATTPSSSPPSATNAGSPDAPAAAVTCSNSAAPSASCRGSRSRPTTRGRAGPGRAGPRGRALPALAPGASPRHPGVVVRARPLALDVRSLHLVTARGRGTGTRGGRDDRGPRVPRRGLTAAHVPSLQAARRTRPGR